MVKYLFHKVIAKLLNSNDTIWKSLRNVLRTAMKLKGFVVGFMKLQRTFYNLFFLKCYLAAVQINILLLE